MLSEGRGRGDSGPRARAGSACTDRRIGMLIDDDFVRIQDRRRRRIIDLPLSFAGIASRAGAPIESSPPQGYDRRKTERRRIHRLEII